MQKKSKKILIINVNWLGDVLFSTPALKTLRQSIPGAYIACLVVSRCEEVLRNNPNIDEIIVYDEYGRHRSFFSKLGFILELRRKKFDVVYVLHQSLKRALIGFLAGIPERIGYDTKNRGFLLTKPVPVFEKPLHKIDYFLRLLECCGIKASDKNCEFFIEENDRKDAEELLKKEGIGASEPFVILNPGGNWFLKRWPIENFAKLADYFIEKKKINVIFTGAKKDVKEAEDILALMRNKAYIFAGKTTLSQLAALMIKAKCVITADSGPMHIAVSAGANTIAIFGPTSPDLTGPRGKGRVVILQKRIGCEVPCYKLECRDNRCMKSVTPDDVFNNAVNFIN